MAVNASNIQKLNNMLFAQFSRDLGAYSKNISNQLEEIHRA
jgi:hypothetical protein